MGGEEGWHGMIISLDNFWGRFVPKCEVTTLMMLCFPDCCDLTTYNTYSREKDYLFQYNSYVEGVQI